MAFLTVAGINISMASGSCDPTEIGDRKRMIDGSMNVTVIATKRTWSIVTIPMTSTAAATLRAALLASPTCTATGDWLGGASLTVWPQVGKDTPVMRKGTFLVVMNFTIAEP